MSLIDGLQADNDWLAQVHVPHRDVPDTVRLNFWDPRTGGKTLELVIGEHLTAEEFLRVNDRGEIWMSVATGPGCDEAGRLCTGTRLSWIECVSRSPDSNDGREVEFFFPTLAERAAGFRVAYRPAPPVG